MPNPINNRFAFSLNSTGNNPRLDARELATLFIGRLQRVSGAQLPRSTQSNAGAMRNARDSAQGARRAYMQQSRAVPQGNESETHQGLYCQPASCFSTEELKEFDRVVTSDIEKLIKETTYTNIDRSLVRLDAMSSVRVLLIQASYDSRFVPRQAKEAIYKLFDESIRLMFSPLLRPMVIEPEGDDLGEPVVVSTIGLIVRSAKLKSASPDPFWLRLLDRAVEVLDQDDLMGNNFINSEDKKLIIKRYLTTELGCQLAGYPNF